MNFSGVAKSRTRSRRI